MSTDAEEKHMIKFSIHLPIYDLKKENQETRNEGGYSIGRTSTEILQLIPYLICPGPDSMWLPIQVSTISLIQRLLGRPCSLVVEGTRTHVAKHSSNLLPQNPMV